MTHVLAVDDEPGVRTSLVRALGLDGFQVSEAADGARALELLDQTQVDVVILDVAMPGIDGLEVCRRLRRRGDRVPVLMLTAKDAVDDRVAGLEAGADDYLVKPFALKELVARIRALIRRVDPGAAPELSYADLTLRRDARLVYRGRREIQLSKTEFSLLELLMQHPGLVMSRTQIFEQVWGYDFGPASNALGVYIGYLRRKLEADGEPRLIHTVRGFGYVLRER
ncbi:MAG: response regulator transcription factor [Solirubrobacterales bacterium]